MWVWVSVLTITVASFLHFGPSFRYFPPSLISDPALFLTLTKLAPHFLQAWAEQAQTVGWRVLAFFQYSRLKLLSISLWPLLAVYAFTELFFPLFLLSWLFMLTTFSTVQLKFVLNKWDKYGQLKNFTELKTSPQWLSHESLCKWHEGQHQACLS